MDPHVLKQLNAARKTRQAAVLVTDLGDGRDRLVQSGDTVAGELGQAIGRVFRSGKSGIAQADGREFFLNVHIPPARMVIIGAVHISQVLAPMAKMAGFDVAIIDPRTAFATPERFEGSDLTADWPEDVLATRPLDYFTALVAVTHDPKIDDYPLISALQAGCFYVGALGSKKTHARRVDRLTDAGLSEEQIARIDAPIGLDIGAASPAEIAVAILAQIIQALRKRELPSDEANPGKQPMKFGPVAISEAEGAILAHSMQAGKARLKKGLVLDPDSISKLVESGIQTVIVARLEDGDIDENTAAAALADAFAGVGIECAAPATGRVNLFARTAGLFRADKQLIDHFNSIDPAITFACLADASVVGEGDMVATIKIIPLAVESAALKAACDAISDKSFARLNAFRARRVAVVATTLPTLKPTVMAKTRALTGTRLSAYGSTLAGYRECAHDTDALAEAIAALLPGHEMVIIFGASAITDPDDVIPAAIRRAGGMVERVGMPVDPGNLLVLGDVDGVPVVGAPGCARSPKENGFDWVLARILADDPPTGADIAKMGVGGLLMEIPTRPQPRALPEKQSDSSVGIVLLAAGRASRMGEDAGHKLLAESDGIPLVRRTAERALSSAADKVVAVSGFRSNEITTALAGLNIACVENADYASGMASSLKTGVKALGSTVAGIMVLLADMPGLTTGHLDQLIAAFAKSDGEAIIRANDGDHRGNPVILPVALVSEIERLEGDVGARALIEASEFPVIDIDIGAAARLDVDTPDAVRAAGGSLEAGKA